MFTGALSFSMAAYLIVKTEKRDINKTGWISSIVLGFLGFAFAFWAIAGAGEKIVYKGFLLLLAGVPFYIWIRYSKKDRDNIS